MRHLFVSPHFDDAVGACGGMIARLARAGGAVTIFTVFGGDAPPAVSAFARQIHRQTGLADATAVRTRRAEDAAAAARLGAAVVAADLPDAIYRQDRAGSWRYPRSLGLVGPLHAEDHALAEIVTRMIAERAGAPDGGTLVHVPLGIGSHVDHRLAHAAGRALARAGHAVAFFEDFWWRDRAPPAAPPGLRRTVVPLAPAEIDAKIAAFAAYRSQIAGLYGSAERMARRLRADARRDGGDGYGEVLWLRAG